MEKVGLSVPAISCNHCIMTIKNELLSVDGVSSVEGSVENRKISVEYDSPATIEKIKSVLNEINFPVSD